MNGVQRTDLDLCTLRSRVAPLFKDYDRAVAASDARAAHAAKMAVTNTALAELAAVLPEQARGLYFFAGEDNLLSSLTYIGVASPGTLRSRMTSRFRDDTCLDAAQYGRTREDVWDTAYRRMCVSMGSEPATLVRYAFDHVKTTQLFAGAQRLIFFMSDASPDAVKSAESLLIYSAVSSGAPLLNIQERDRLTTEFGTGRRLAMEVINLGRIGNAHWSARAATLLSRFRDTCC